MFFSVRVVNNCVYLEKKSVFKILNITTPSHIAYRAIDKALEQVNLQCIHNYKIYLKLLVFQLSKRTFHYSIQAWTNLFENSKSKCFFDNWSKTVCMAFRCKKVLLTYVNYAIQKDSIYIYIFSQCQYLIVLFISKKAFLKFFFIEKHFNAQ